MIHAAGLSSYCDLPSQLLLGVILFHPAEENELVSSTLNGKLHFSIRIKSRLQQALINTFGYEPEAPVQLEILAGDKGLRAVTD